MATIVERRDRDPSEVLFVCDFTPPRGPDPALLDPARGLPADFISVAYNPGKSVRVNSVIVAYWIKQNTDRDVLFTVATRDMNKVAAESMLLGAGLLGLENLVVVKGDRFSERELSMVKSVDDFRPTELVRAVASMNEGLDFKGGKLRSPTELCVGATIDLGLGLEAQTKLTHRKVEAGVRYFLMQAVFDPALVRRFLDGYADTYGEELTSPVFCGVQVVTTDGMVFGDVPEWITADLEKGRDAADVALEVLGTFVDAGFRSIYLVPPILRAGRRDYAAATRVLKGFRP
jgi:5,10-methylenetetrahydrofolate reductase